MYDECSADVYIICSHGNFPMHIPFPFCCVSGLTFFTKIMKLKYFVLLLLCDGKMFWLYTTGFVKPMFKSWFALSVLFGV
jgi:hypothetical protein